MLNSSKNMMFSLSNKVGFMRKLCGIKYAKVFGYSVCSDTSLPPSVSFVHTKKSALIVASAIVKILGVFRRRRLSQINYSVVSPDPVNVINLLLRPRTMHMNPYKSVSKVKATEYSDANVVVVGAVPRLVAYLHSMRWPYSPVKIASLRVVVKYFAQILCGKIGLSHDTVPSLIGQRPRRVDSTSGLRHFSFYAFGCTA